MIEPFLQKQLLDENNITHLAGENTNSIQSGTPTQWFNYQNTSSGPQTLDLYVTRKQGSTGTPRFKFIIQRPSAPSSVQWNTSQGPDIVGPSVYGHNATHALAAATGFVSTAGDLARFFASLLPDAKRSVLSVESRREMGRRQWREPHSSLARWYGLGTICGTLGDWDWCGHSGGTGLERRNDGHNECAKDSGNQPTGYDDLA